MALKIIHTADWHLGQTFFGYDRVAEHDAFLRWLEETVEEQKADVLLIAGDVFDVANPSADSQRRFFRFLRNINKVREHLQVIVIAGNHDSAARLEAPVPLLEELNTTVIGFVRRKEDRSIDYSSMAVSLYGKQGRPEAVCMAVPYLRQGDLPPMATDRSYIKGISLFYHELYAFVKSEYGSDVPVIALGHLHLSGAELSDEDRSERVLIGGLESVSVTDLPGDILYYALGHIHKAQRVGRKETVRYAGSPLPMSFAEQHYRHQVVCLTVDDGNITRIEPLFVPLHTELLRIPAEASEPALVLEALRRLPLRRKNMEQDNFPFLEVRVLLREPEPGFRHQVESVLQDKAVRLTSIVPVYEKCMDESAEKMLSYADLQKLEPLTILQRTFSARYGGKLPDELKSLFMEVVAEVKNED